MSRHKTFLAAVKNAAVVVAHPDDEIIWTGGLLLAHSGWRVTLMSLCRASDPDRAPRFTLAASELGADGFIADLPDEPSQKPLDIDEVCRSISDRFDGMNFELLLTHSPGGEYTRHRRHEEVGTAAARLWHSGKLAAGALWTFAYEDGEGKYIPRPSPDAHYIFTCDKGTAAAKRRIIAEIYGFPPASFEFRAAKRKEAFYCHYTPGHRG